MNVQVGAPSTFSKGDPASSQENPTTLLLGPPIIKRGDFLNFKKSLLGNGSPLAGLDRMNVQVGAPSTFPQGDPASSQENPSTLLRGPPIIKRGDFLNFKKSLLGNGRPLAALDRMNVQVGAPSMFPQGDLASSQENPTTLL